MVAFRAIVGIGVAMSLGCLPHTEPPPAATASANAPAANAPAATAPTASAMPSTAPSTASLTAPAEATASPGPVAPAVPAEPVPASEPAAAASPAPPGTQQIAAKAGVGLKGQSLQQESGMMVSAAKAFFNVQQKAVFDIQIPEALKLFKATEGRGPQSHDEFLTKIVAANMIQLPQLPAGQKYVYDPQREELMVEKPAK